MPWIFEHQGADNRKVYCWYQQHLGDSRSSKLWITVIFKSVIDSVFLSLECSQTAEALAAMQVGMLTVSQDKAALIF